MENKSTTNSYDLSFYKVNNIQTNAADPYGFNTNIIDTAYNRNKREDINEVKLSKAADVVSAAFKGIFMQLLSFYFIGSSLSLISICIIAIYANNCFSSMLNVNNVFKQFESPEHSLFIYKIGYVLVQSIVLSVIMYRVYGLGLIPLNAADWINLIDLSLPKFKILAN